MKTLNFSLITLIVIFLITFLPAAEPDEAFAMKNTPETNVSNATIIPAVRVLNPEPMGGYSNLKEKIEYPEYAKLAGIAPKLVVRTYIDAKGQIRDCQIIEGPKKIGFEKSIFNAIRETEWTPATYNGIATPSNLDITFKFKLYD